MPDVTTNSKYKLRWPALLPLFCLGMLAGNSHVLAGDVAQLISVSITNGTSMMPRTMFTQTWTMKNTGTTTWSPGYNGYTMNIRGADNLGAVPLIAKTFASHTPSATIGSGMSIGPGTMATFTMTFITPEAAGSVTDNFQLNNASSVFFGPTNSVQIVVLPAGSTNQYDRARVVSYANNYSGYVNSDGYFWTNGSSYVTYAPQSPAPSSGLGDDCAHFVSCCIGSEQSQRGGGLTIPSRGAADLRRTGRHPSCLHDLDRSGLCRRSIFVD
jgi:Ig-like domain from next to BRCA1 gene